jgi:peptidoglycan/xylan/chitin deacetylase (PgdA/CDA1 family)
VLPRRRASHNDLQTLPRVVVSVDFERRWGLHHRLGLNRDAYLEHLENAHPVVTALLDLFGTRKIRATWAAVGALACRDWAEYFERAPQPPAYQNPALAVSPRYAELDRDGHLHFAPDLLRAVHAKPGQELGTHTFSHILMREPGVTHEDVKADLEAVARLWRQRFGAPPVSLVFPRNQISFLSTIRSCGIRMWRGNEHGWYYDCNETSTNRSVARARRLLDAINPWMHHSSPLEGDMTRASLFLRTNLPAPAWALHLARIRNELAALRPSQVFHIWWHDHNLGADFQRRVSRVEQVCDMIAERCERGQLLSTNMGDLLRQQQSAVAPAEAQRARR